MVIERELPYDELIRLIENLKNIFGVQSQVVVSDIQPILSGHGSTSNIQLKKNRYDIQGYELLLETHSEIRGWNVSKQSIYKIYRNKDTQEIKGIVNTGKRKYGINLGSPSDPSSEIFTVIKAVNAMPFNEGFTKRNLRESLPSSFTRGNKMKIALDYIEKIAKIVERTIEYDSDTGAVMYRRAKALNENGNNRLLDVNNPLENLNKI